ncbi:MAG: DNA alkylation repair protein [Thermoguttaceae bacterium]|nr:DNA alkylation repair protein [Thermoguttaceae bacterium]
MARQPLDASWFDFNKPVESLRARLTPFADPGYREFFRNALPKNCCDLYGIRVGVVRQIVDEILSLDGERALDAFLFPPKSKSRRKRATPDFLEERLAIAFLLGKAKIPFDKRLSALAAYLPLVDSWAICDELCAAVKPKPDELPAHWEFLNFCLSSDAPYYRRVGLVFMLKRFLNESYIGAVLDRVEDLAPKVDHSTVSFGIAWLLCEAFIKRPDETLRYLKDNSLDDQTMNRAIRKISESHRVDDETKRELQETLTRPIARKKS